MLSGSCAWSSITVGTAASHRVHVLLKAGCLVTDSLFCQLLACLWHSIGQIAACPYGGMGGAQAVHIKIDCKQQHSS